MITNLLFKVEFAPTTKHPEGKVIKGDHEFEKGLSAITGKNEAGKSLRIEMIRYALFGTKALRGAASTYKSIEAQLNFVVLGTAYELKRKGSKATLNTVDGVEIATGTKPVNNAVIRILGYDMEVFDIANACLQGEIEAMTNMPPSKRKEMVDRTIGLNAIDEVSKVVAEDLSSTKKAMEMLNEKVIQRYELPAMPQDMDPRSSSELEQHLMVLREKAQDKKFIEGQLKSTKCEAPAAKPADCNITETVDELKAQAHAVELEFSNLSVTKEKIKSYERIQAQLAGYDLNKILHYLENNYHEKWLAHHRYEEERLTHPGYTKEDLDFLQEGFYAEGDLNRKVDVTCPSCQAPFSVLNNGHIHEDKFDWPRFNTLKEAHGIKGAGDLMSLGYKLNNYHMFEAMPVVDKPEIEEIPDAIKLHAIIKLAEEYKDFDAVAESAIVHDKEVGFNQVRQELEAKIKLKQSQLVQEKLYETALEKYTAYVKLRDELQPQLNLLASVDEELTRTQEQYIVVRNYEQALKDYHSKQEAQQTALTTLGELQTNAESLTQVKKSLLELKPKVKMHLLPSLNRVASTLLAQMTNNERNSIVVNEDFDILVDGQAVNTLSGSGKAISNLAVRIGLGTVLTNKVFSVFLADEIDASMDKQRAAYTAECLQNLTGVISQIILVSHQKPAADHQIEV